MSLDLVDPYPFIVVVVVMFLLAFFGRDRRARVLIVCLSVFFVVFGVWMFSRPSVRWILVGNGSLVNVFVNDSGVLVDYSDYRFPRGGSHCYIFQFADGGFVNLSGSLVRDISSNPLYFNRSTSLSVRYFDSMIRVDQS